MSPFLLPGAASMGIWLFDMLMLRKSMPPVDEEIGDFTWGAGYGCEGAGISIVPTGRKVRLIEDPAINHRAIIISPLWGWGGGVGVSFSPV